MHALVQFQFQHTAARRRLLLKTFRNVICDKSFNTQPPEGGCPTKLPRHYYAKRFNTQPPEGGCTTPFLLCSSKRWFQHTAARRRLLRCHFYAPNKNNVSTHSRPKAAAHCIFKARNIQTVSTHSRPKAAAPWLVPCGLSYTSFQHTAARRRLQWFIAKSFKIAVFQHTAARRRLLPT